MRAKRLVYGTVGAMLVTLGAAMFITSEGTKKAEYSLYELGVEFYNNGSYESAYSTFECIINANESMGDEKLNKRFPDIIELDKKAFDEMCYDNIADFINKDQDYQAAIEEAYKMNDTDRKDEIVSEILYIVGEDAICENKTLEGEN